MGAGMQEAAAGPGLMQAALYQTVLFGGQDVEQERVQPAPLPPQWNIELQIDFGKDVGQNFGSLFEALDHEGRVVAGAGFLGAYNTYYRAARHTLHAYAKPPHGASDVAASLLPRPSESCHHYLFEADGGVHATSRAAGAPTFRWTPTQEAWQTAEPAQSPVMQVGSRRLEFGPSLITVDGRQAFRFDPASGTAGSYYYAQGHLFFHVAAANDPDRRTFLHACPWDVDSETEPRLEHAVVQPLTAPGEFPYSYGQRDGDVLVGTNNGGVYRFRAGAWHTLRPADPKTSFQLYAMINVRNRLLMGHYPSGELFEVAGDEVKQLVGWPPRPAAATASAREAQTLTLYRGELFAGIWPWGEVWRLHDDAWEFVGRLFEHPAMAPETTAPYESIMTALGEKVNNLWGQRVTALIPFGDGLIASTSNKNGAPFEDRLTFLANGRAQEYGAVHRLYLPGHLSAPTAWTGKPTTFEMVLTPDTMTLLQDGQVIGAATLPAGAMEGFQIRQMRWGDGVFGPLQGQWSAESCRSI